MWRGREVGEGEGEGGRGGGERRTKSPGFGDISEG